MPARPVPLPASLALLAAMASCAAASPPAAPPAPMAARAAAAAPPPTREPVTAPSPVESRGQLPADGRIDAELRVRRLLPGVLLVTHEPAYASNVLVVEMPDGTLVLCSSPFETEATVTLVRWLRRTLKPTRIVAINTHFHLDGTGGNDGYAREGVITYASHLTQALLRERGARVRDEVARTLPARELRPRVAAMRIVPAAHTFDARRGLSLTFGGERVEVLYPGRAHSPDNVVVHFPARRLLFGGCMIKTGRSIGYTGAADLGAWEESVKNLEPLRPTLVVPGHGAPGGPALFQNTIAVVRRARAR